MSNKPYSERIIKVQIMIDGLKEHQDNLPTGVKSSVATELKILKDKVEQINSEQERMKAELKKKTEEYNAEKMKMDKLYSDTKKRIKLDIEKSLWRKFGIEDKR